MIDCQSSFIMVKSKAAAAGGQKKRKATNSHLKQGSIASFFGVTKKSKPTPKSPAEADAASKQSSTTATAPNIQMSDKDQKVTPGVGSPAEKMIAQKPNHTENADPVSKKARRITVSPAVVTSKYGSNVRVEDFEDEIPSDAEDAILLHADSCNTVKVAVRKSALGSHTSTSSQQNSQQQQYSSVADGARHMKKVYDAGDHLPCLSQPQEFFDDMVQQLLKMPDPFRKPTGKGSTGGPVKKGGIGSFFAKKKEPAAKPTNKPKLDTAHKVLLPFLQKMKNRSLRVATMCSGTESPVLALDMLQKALDDACVEHGYDKELGIDTSTSSVLTIEHIFSCEIEPFKQAYIERNFSPPLLFRDIRELGHKEAHTAYGGLAEVPNTPGSVDILIAGTSCVDYSNLNNRQKKIDEEGESGQTFFGMMKWIDQAQPPIVVIENVLNAPWDIKVQIFEERGYVANFCRVDTKDL